MGDIETPIRRLTKGSCDDGVVGTIPPSKRGGGTVLGARLAFVAGGGGAQINLILTSKN